MATGTLFTLLAIAFELSTRSALIVGFGLATRQVRSTVAFE